MDVGARPPVDTAERDEPGAAPWTASPDRLSDAGGRVPDDRDDALQLLLLYHERLLPLLGRVVENQQRLWAELAAQRSAVDRADWLSSRIAQLAEELARDQVRPDRLPPDLPDSAPAAQDLASAGRREADELARLLGEAQEAFELSAPRGPSGEECPSGEAGHSAPGRSAPTARSGESSEPAPGARPAADEAPVGDAPITPDGPSGERRPSVSGFPGCVEVRFVDGLVLPMLRLRVKRGLASVVGDDLVRDAPNGYDLRVLGHDFDMETLGRVVESALADSGVSTELHALDQAETSSGDGGAL